MRRLRQLARLGGQRGAGGGDKNGVQAREQTGVAPLPERLAQAGEEEGQLLLPNLCAELLGGGVFEMVRLVYHQIGVLRQHLALERLVGEQERVVDY